MPEGAVYVGRPSQWGNDLTPDMPDLNGQPLGIERAVSLYRTATLRFMEDILDDEDVSPGGIRAEAEAWLAPLRGRDLVCWCPLEDDQGNRVPCHADVLLELANR